MAYLLYEEAMSVRLYATDSVLGIIIDKNLNWHHQISNVAAKLNRANTMLLFIMLFLSLT